MLRQLYNWTMSFAAHRNAKKALAAISFAESSFFPIPPDVLLIPMALAERRKAFEIAAICTIASVLGGMLGYAIGAFLYDTVGQWVVDVYHLENKMETFKAQYEEWGILIILLAGFTPIPYKVFTITSGLLAYDFGLFVLLSFMGRGGRFFLLAALLYYFGDPIRGFIERRLEILTAGVAAVAVTGFVLVRYGI
ncbi:MAG: DedA family protein [Hyphomicrobiales bacterium]|nr:DedA family protein [Hyphomicrobiales bacterium]